MEPRSYIEGPRAFPRPVKKLWHLRAKGPIQAVVSAKKAWMAAAKELQEASAELGNPPASAVMARLEERVKKATEDEVEKLQAFADALRAAYGAVLRGA